VISETFIVRQAKALNANIITLKSNESLYKFFDFDYSKVFQLRSNSKIPLHEKISNKIQGISFRRWHEKDKKQFEKILIQNNIQFVIAHFGPNGINVSKICSELNIPFLIHFHGYDVSSLLNNDWYKAEIVQAIKRSYKSIVLYKGHEQVFLDLGLSRDFFEVVNMGVPMDVFKKGFLSSSQPFNFLHVGRFTAKKAPLLSIKAMEYCIAKNKNVFLNMIGEGELLGQVKRYVKKNDLLQSRVKLWGGLSQKGVIQLHFKSHAFIQHSITSKTGDKEGWPISIAEAQASGLPTISTWHAGIPTQVIHGETGYLVKEGDWRLMGEYMYKLSSDIDLCRHLGEAAHKHISESGDLKKKVLKIKNLINAALN